MPTYRVTLGDKSFNITADSFEQAATAGRLYLAGEQGVSQAEAGATARAEAPREESPWERLGRSTTFGTAPTPEEARTMSEERIPEFAMGAAALAPLLTGAVAAPAATAKGLLGGMVGGAAGGEAGRWVGRNLPIVGGETAANVLGGVGGLAGGVTGGIAVPKVGLKGLMNVILGGRGGALGKLVGAEAGPVAAPVTAEVAAKKAATDLAIKEARLQALQAKAARDAEWHAARMERLSLSGTAKPKAIKPPVEVPKPTVEAPPASTPPRNTTGVLTSGKPGPPPTPPDQVEEALRRSIEAAKAKAASPLQVPRVQVGAQKVGKPLGLTKEQVRMETGPILGEKLGEASPIIPKEPWERIVETMKALPKTGGAREAYVARAAPGKNRGQMEQLRRTLEQLGLLLPIGAGGVALTSDSE